MAARSFDQTHIHGFAEMTDDHAAIAQTMDEGAFGQHESAVVDTAAVANAQDIAGQRVLIRG